MSNELFHASVVELSEKLAKKEISAVELAKVYLDRIEQNKDLNAFLDVRAEATLQQAKQADARIASGDATRLTGIPIAHKDLFVTKEWATTAASKMLDGYMSPFNATVVENLNRAGMVCLGKLNCDEFAMGGGNENSAYGKVLNPWNKNCVPGGSSGGSSSAVAASLAPVTTGTDTGGSIREPAVFTGVTGLKPTYGLVSRYGLVAFASSLDQVGPITKDVTDCATLLNIIAGHDEKDSTSYNREKVDYTLALKKDIKGLKIGVPKEFFGEGINTDVKKKLEEAIEKYKQMGAIVETCSLDIAEYALAAYYIIACAEASSNLGRFDGIRYGYRTKNYTNLSELFKNSRSEGFGPEVKRRIILGTYVLSSGYYDAYYKKAQQVRTLVKQEFEKQFEKYDVLLTPVAPTTAFNIGSKSKNPLEMYLADICTVSINIAGVPAISIPCGVDREGMPVGMQLIGNRFSEEKILNAAYAFEQEIKFREKYKPEFKK